ncbi:MAG TPA: hypothetical protein VIJ36_09475 [Thermoanaerobaculia bacterium]
MRPRSALRSVTFVLALGLAAASARGDVQGFHYTREAAVPAPGWVRVPLDLAAVRHLAPGGADLHVFSPSGGEIPARLEPAPPRTERRPADSFRLEAADDGWLLSVDLGPGPLSHQRLFLSPARSPLPPPDRVESSPDGSSWQPLAVRGPETVEEVVAFAYPLTTDRHLRLHWSRRRQETPRVSAVAVETVASPVLSVPTPNAECVPGPPGALFCTLPLPAAGQTLRRVTLDVEGKGLVGFRLYAPRDARWLPVAEGVWQPAGGRTRHEITPGPEPVAGAALRLELHAVGSRPRLAGWGLDLTAPAVLFRADGAGSHTLAYGGARQPEPRPAEPPAGGHPLWVEPGPESEHGLPALPAVATAPGVRLNERRTTASWRIAAPSARPGFLVRLELPPVVYAQARADLANLRVLSGDRQVPFQIWSPEEPALALADRDLRLQASGGRRSGDSAVEIHLLEPGLPLSQIAITAPSVPLRRPTSLRYLEPATTPAREVRRRGRPTLVQDVWECRPQPPLPCRNLLPLPGRAPSVVEVSFHDLDNPPLAALAADLWRRRDVLLFVWPDAEEPVRLVAGPDTLTAPSYDLQALGDALLSYPWQPAELSQGRAPARIQPWWSRWMRPMTLLAAAMLLLLLLRRILMAT